jgi:cytosine/adenosine deaminase-related metal-dependent hydrolase
MPEPLQPVPPRQLIRNAAWHEAAQSHVYVYAAGERAIRHVFVGGQQAVRDGKVLAFDYADARGHG